MRRREGGLRYRGELFSRELRRERRRFVGEAAREDQILRAKRILGLTHEPFRRLGPERAQRLLDLMQPYVEQLYGGGIATQWPPPHLMQRAE